MPPGLSDRDRARLERAREQAEVKIAAERRRIERARERVDRRRPLHAVAPDGTTVQLTVLPSGAVPAGVPDLLDFGSSELGFLLAALLFVIPLTILLVSLVIRWTVFRGGWTVHIEAPERAPIAIRLRTKEAAAQRMREVAAAVEREGLSALDPWIRRGRRRPGREFGETPAG